MMFPKRFLIYRIFSAFVLAALLGIPGAAHATLQETGSGLQNLINLLNTNRASIPVSTLNRVDQGAAQTLQTAAELEKVDISGLVRAIETFEQSSKSVLGSGGSVAPLASLLTDIQGKLAPIANITASGASLSDFSSVLSSLGGSLPQGASDVLTQASQGIQGIQQAVTVLGSIRAGNLQQAAQVASVLITSESTSGGFIPGGFFSTAVQVSPATREAITKVSQQLGGSVGSLLSGASALSGGVNKIMKAGSSALGIGGAVPACANTSFGAEFIKSISSSGVNLFKGVPVVEQGQLLTVTNRTAGFTELICNLMNETNTRINELIKKEFILDPAESLKAQTAVLNISDQTIKSAKTSFDGPEGIENASLVPPNIGELKRLSAIEQVKNIIESVKESNISNEEKRAIIVRIKKDYLVKRDPNAELKSILDPTKNALNSPYGSAQGRYLAVKNLLDERIGAAEVDVDQQLLRNQGFLDRRECPQGSRLADGTCKYGAWQTVSPGSLFANSVTEANLAALRIAQNGREIGEFENNVANTALPNLPEQTKQFTAAAAGQTLRSVPRAQTTVAAPPAAAGGAATEQPAASGIFATIKNVLSNLQKVSDVACRISPNLSICPGSGGKNVVTAGDLPPTVLPAETVVGGPAIVPPPPLPAALVASSTGGTLDGRTVSVLVWETREAEQCSAGNNWVSYGTGDRPTLAVEVVAREGAALSLSGAATIYHPALFRAQASAAEGATNQNTLPPPSQVRAVANRVAIATTSSPFPSSTVSQTAVYSPNMNNLESDDIIAFGVNSLFIGAFGSSTPRAVSDTIRRGLASTELSAAHQAEYRGYQIGGTDSVTLTRGAEVSGFIRADASYVISCVGTSGERLEETIRLNFAQ